MRWRRFGTAHYPALGVALAVGLAAALLLAAWRWPWPDGGVTSPARPAAPSPGGHASAVDLATAPAAPELPPQRAAATGALASRTAAPPPEELCGVGIVQPVREIDSRRPDPMDPWPDHLGRHALDAARERTLAVLEQGGLRERVVARVWRDLRLRLGARADLDAAASAALVQEAAAAQDVVAQATALRLCHHLPDVQACHRQLVAAALRTDPGNARWHAHQLALGPDPEAAWQALLQAPAWRSGFGELIAVVRAAAPPDLPRYLAHMLAFDGLWLDAGLVDALSPMMRRCRLDSPAADRAPQADCDRLAHLLLERSDTLLTAGLGRRAAEAAGWPAERLAALAQEHEALRTAFSRKENLAQPLGCAAIEATERYFEAVARDGEMAALRALIRR